MYYCKVLRTRQEMRPSIRVSMNVFILGHIIRPRETDSLVPLYNHVHARMDTSTVSQQEGLAGL